MAINYKVRLVTTTPNLITTDDEVIWSNVSQPSVLTLPTLSNSSDNCGRSFYIKDYSGNSKTNSITITPPSGKTIDGAAFAIINTQYGRLMLTFDGLNWKTLAG